jgi:hypothetical protein
MDKKGFNPALSFRVASRLNGRPKSQAGETSQKTNTIIDQRACLFPNWLKMVLIPFSCFKGNFKTILSYELFSTPKHRR